MVFLQNMFDARAVVGRFRENEFDYSSKTLLHGYSSIFNLTHVVTRSVSLILLKSGFVAYQLKHSIGFRKMCLTFGEYVSAVTVI